MSSSSSRKRPLSPSAPSSSARRSTFDANELSLENERLLDKVASLTEDLTRCKEKSVRQLTYMEEENEKMRKTAKDIKEKYYEEKRKWQKQLRETQKAQTTAQDQPPIPPATALSSPSSVSKTLFHEHVNDEWSIKLENLQNQAELKSQEAHRLSIENADLKLQLKTLSGTDTTNNSSGNREDSLLAEARELRHRNNEIEMNMKLRNGKNACWKYKSTRY